MTIATDQWHCVKCKNPRLIEHALPPLKPSLTGRYMVGKCRTCRSMAFFEQGPARVARDPQLGERLKEHGMKAAASYQASLNPEWSAKVDATITALALSRREFTSEDITANVGMPPSGSGSAVGARVNAAARSGRIVWTGKMAKAQRPNQHAALLKLWRGA
jgi:hypothetical protein